MSGLTIQNRAQAGRTLRIGNKDVSFDAEGIAKDVPSDCEMFTLEGRSLVRGFQLIEGVPITPAAQEMQDAGGMAHVYCQPHFAGKTLSCVGGDVTFDENCYAYAPANYFKGVRGFRVELEQQPEIQPAESLADLPYENGALPVRTPNPAEEIRYQERAQEIDRQQAEAFDQKQKEWEGRMMEGFDRPEPDTSPDPRVEGFRSCASAVPPLPEPEDQEEPVDGEGTTLREFEETDFQPPTGEVPPSDETFLPMAPSGNLTPTGEEPAKPQSRKRK